MESLRDFVCGAKKGVPLVLPFLLNNEQQFFESYGPVSGSLRKIGPSEEWFLSAVIKMLTGQPPLPVKA